MDRYVAHLHVSIELDSDPITGSVAAPWEEPRPFNGWIELTEEIERARQCLGHQEENPGVAAWGEGPRK